MNNSTSLFFIALLPPSDIQARVTQIKQYFATNYASRAALKSPPHITLQPPFKWSNADVSALEACLRTFARDREPISVTLDGFAAFPPRVIYINVLKTQKLLTLHTDLMAHLEGNLAIVDKASKTRPFAPHMTVAFRDLSKQNFRAAWSEFQQRQLHFEFIATDVTLLLHDGRRWNVSTQLPFLPGTSKANFERSQP
ncbi:MAG: 2'-5' RNA ligase family protein [Tolypothrix sp. T3-bin4]|nr:2'-5' RNA ligase family protein [Tolypothrix sp. T3-bin4]